MGNQIELARTMSIGYAFPSVFKVVNLEACSQDECTEYGSRTCINMNELLYSLGINDFKQFTI